MIWSNVGWKAGVIVVVTIQCITGSVILGHNATGQVLKNADVVSVWPVCIKNLFQRKIEVDDFESTR